MDLPAEGTRTIARERGNVTPVNRLVPTLYEDAGVLVVVKPAGIDVGGTPGGGSNGLVELLDAVLDRAAPLQPVNRLSRFESGILLLGKSPEIGRDLRAALKSKRVNLEYVALVSGRMPRRKIVLDADRGTSRGRGRPARSRVRGGRSPDLRRGTGSSAGGRTTLTLMRATERRSLIRCHTTAANTHILRAQLRSLKLRLVGDNVRQRSPRRTENDDTCLHLAKISLKHPRSEKEIVVRSRPPDAFGVALEGKKDIERFLVAALTRRLECLTEKGTDSYRLITGSAEGVRGIVAEKYGETVVFQVHEEGAGSSDNLLRMARFYRDVLGTRAVYVKRFVTSRAGINEELDRSHHSPEPFFGKPVQPRVEIVERGIRYLIRPYDGFSVGLFLDQRENRTLVRELAAEKDVLNLFAYTCGFSVAAALGGARSTVSVDISPRHLEWGRENFEANGLDPANHMFIRSDAADYLKRAKRQEKRFDLIVLDPPSFAHGRKTGRKFSVLSDLAGLVAGAAELLRPTGSLMISTNHRRLSARGLRDRLDEGARRRRFRVVTAPPLPVDFSSDPQHAKTVIARFEG